MKNLSFNFGTNNGSFTNDNPPIPFCIQIIQNSAVIATCYSTESDPVVTGNIFIKTVQFDDSIATTIKYYNLGKQTNSISLSLLNGNTFDNTNYSFPTISDGRSNSVSIGTNNLASYYLSIISRRVSTISSGVAYAVSGNTIVSSKTGDSNFVSSATPNISDNPNYTQPLAFSAPVTLPTAGITSVVNTQQFGLGGMNNGDIFVIYKNGTKISVDSGNGVVIISSTGQIYYPITSEVGNSFVFSYIRGGVESLKTPAITVTGAAVLPTITISSANNYALNTNVYVGEGLLINSLATGASLVVKKGDGSIATLDTDYSLNTSSTPAGTFGTISFLLVGNYQLQQSKTGSTTSTALAFTISTGTRPQTVKPVLNLLGSSISIDLTGTENSIELFIKNSNGTFSKVGNTIVTGLSTYVFSNVLEGVYKAKITEVNKLVSAFSDEVTSFLTPSIAGSTARSLGDTLIFSNIKTGDNLEVGKSTDNGTTWTTTTVSNITVTVVSNVNTYSYTPDTSAKYRFRRISGSLTSGYSSVITIGSAVTSSPVLSSASIIINTPVTITNIVSGDILSYVKDGTSNVSLGVINAVSYVFTPTAGGTYQFKLTRANIDSALSSTLTVISGTECVLSNLVLSQNVDNPTLYDVTIINQQSVTLKYILKNSNNEVVLEDSLSTSTTFVTNQIKAQIDFSNVVEDAGYTLLFLSTTQGKTCSIQSDSFDFNIISADPTDVVLLGSETKDCREMTLSQITDSVKTQGLEISFGINYNTAITNNPSYLITITKSDGTELFQDGTNILIVPVLGKIKCIIPTNKIPNKFTQVTITATVSANPSNPAGANLSDVYGCVSTANYTITSDIQKIYKSTAPILDAITINSNVLSFTSNCLGTLGKFFVNNEAYTLNSVTSDNNNYIISTPITTLKPLKVGDVITAKQTCPNQLESDSSGSITVLSTCTKISGGIIEGDINVVQNALKTYKVKNLVGSSPYTYETTVVGGEIVSGNNTSEIVVKITSNISAVIGFKVKNCNDNYFINLTQSVIVSQVQTGNLTPPQIVGLNNRTLTGISEANITVTVFNENNEVVAKSIPSNDKGVWKVSNLRKYKAYYAIAFFQNTKSNISNIFVVDGNNSSSCGCSNKIIL
jgi:hypothetical protein